MNTANLRKLLDAATPRPWRHWSSDPPYGSRGSTFDAVEDMSSQPIINWSGFDASAFPPRQRRVNAAMIVELVNNADELLAEVERLRAAKCPTWSFIRTLLEQGAAIRQDYDAGKFGESYEAYSARIDEAAREREDTLTALEQKA